MLLSYAIFFNSLYFFAGYLFNPDVFLRLTHRGEVARLGGYIMNPNELGMLSSLGASCVILDFSREKKKWLYVVFLSVNLAVMFLTGSRSSSIGFMLVCALITWRSDNIKLKAVMVAGFLFVAPIVVNELILNEEKGGLDGVMSMTGRLPFWKALITEGLPNEPFFGFGFQNIYYTKFFQGKNTYPASMTHNTFVQVLMNLGLVGFFLVMMQMTLVFRNVIKEKNKEKAFAFWCMFTPPFINSLTEFGIWGETNYGILFYQLLFLWFIVEVKGLYEKSASMELKQVYE
jgi:O-antigen ligase